MLECGIKHAQRTSVYTMSERSLEASGAGARSGIPRWSGNGNGGGGRLARARQTLGEGGNGGLREEKCANAGIRECGDAGRKKFTAKPIPLLQEAREDAQQ